MSTPKALITLQIKVEERNIVDQLKEKNITQVAIFRRGLKELENELLTK